MFERTQIVVKTCSACENEKPISDFYVGKAKCKICYNLTRVPNKRTPAQRADYRRRTGQVSSDVAYRTIEEIRSAAAAKRELRQERSDILRLGRVERAAIKSLFGSFQAVGTRDWLSNASRDQIEAVRLIADLKFRRSLKQRSMSVIQFPLGGKYAVGENAFTLIDEEDLSLVENWAWKPKLNGAKSGWYAVRNVNENGRHRTVRMHRTVMRIDILDGLEPDHIDHNTLNNSLSNLRLVTRRENSLNRKLLT